MKEPAKETQAGMVRKKKKQRVWCPGSQRRKVFQGRERANEIP